MTDMHAENTAHQKALENVNLLIDANILLPENVFRGIWGGFYFFDPDWIFDEDFVEEAKALLEVDGGQSVCLLDLEVKAAPGSQWYSFHAAPGSTLSTFFFDKDVTSASYKSFFDGPTNADESLRRLSRYGCTSDVGQWCIYCEMQNEIGVIAIRDILAKDKYLSALDRFGPTSIQHAIEIPPSFAYEHLCEEFRFGLLDHYSKPHRNSTLDTEHNAL